MVMKGKIHNTHEKSETIIINNHGNRRRVNYVGDLFNYYTLHLFCPVLPK